MLVVVKVKVLLLGIVGFLSKSCFEKFDSSGHGWKGNRLAVLGFLFI